jgi:hypothetical protein
MRQGPSQTVASPRSVPSFTSTMGAYTRARCHKVVFVLVYMDNTYSVRK